MVLSSLQPTLLFFSPSPRGSLSLSPFTFSHTPPSSPSFSANSLLSLTPLTSITFWPCVFHKTWNDEGTPATYPCLMHRGRRYCALPLSTSPQHRTQGEKHSPVFRREYREFQVTSWPTLTTARDHERTILFIISLPSFLLLNPLKWLRIKVDRSLGSFGFLLRRNWPENGLNPAHNPN